LFTLRYLIWRSVFTINWEAWWFAFILLVAEIQGFIEVGLFYFEVWQPTRRIPPPPLPGKTVAVLVTTFNEPLHILRDTLIGCSCMRYPHTTYVLDDGNRPEVKELAKEFGFGYIARPTREHGKAGNLNYALPKTDGEFIATFDADHVPRPEFIEETVGFFGDERVAFVQTYQDYYNIDSFQHNTDIERELLFHEEQVFYGVVMPGKDRWNAACFCGTSAIIRRSALVEVGGFATETLTEDVHTSIRMQARGWRSVYYNKVLARGVAPESYQSFYIQKLRWGRGNMRILRFDNPLTIPGLTIPQRLSYFSSIYSYLNGLQKIVYLATPLIVIFTGILPLNSPVMPFLSYFLPYFLLNVTSCGLAEGGFRAILLNERLNLIKTIANIISLGGVIKEYRFLPTPKGNEKAAELQQVLMYVVVLCAQAIAIPLAIGKIYFWDGQSNIPALAGSLIWTALYLYLLGPVTWQALKRSNVRVAYRFQGKLEIPGRYRLRGSDDLSNAWNDTYIRNANRFGCSLTTSDPLPRGQEILLDIELQKQVLKLAGKIITSSPLKLNRGRVRFINGIQFLKCSIQDQDAISQYLIQEVALRQQSFSKYAKKAAKWTGQQ